MNFQEAASTRLLFGKHSGKPIDVVATTDEGLLYLDWLYGERARSRKKSTEIDEALRIYLSDPTIAKELTALVARGGKRHDDGDDGTPDEPTQRRVREAPLRSHTRYRDGRR